MSQPELAGGVGLVQVGASLDARSQSERSGAVPTRTCVGCRIREAKTQMVRIVVLDDEFTPDPDACLPGRGAYLHPARGCLDRALRRGTLRRALRVSTQVRSERLSEHSETWN